MSETTKITPSVFDNVFIKILIDSKLRNFKENTQEEIEYLCGLVTNEILTFIKIGKLAIKDGHDTPASFLEKLDSMVEDYTTVFTKVGIEDDSYRIFNTIFTNNGDMV